VHARLHKPFLVSSVAAVAVALAAAAADGGSAKMGEPARPTKAAFIGKADAICRRADDQEAPLIYKAASDLAGSGPKLLVVLRAKYSALRALVPPAGFDRGWNSLLAQMKANIDRYGRNVQRAKAGKDAREDTSTPLGRLTDSMRAYGFKWCP